MEGTVSTSSPSQTKKTLLPDLLHHHLMNGHSLSLWRTPNSDEKHLLICEAVTKLQELSLEDSSTGFVFAPFEPGKEKIFLNGDAIYSFKKGEFQVERSSDLPPTLITGQAPPRDKKSLYHSHPSDSAIEKSKDEFIQLVASCVEAIRSGQFEKVVPSRRKIISLPERFDPFVMFEKLCERYPQALVSLVSTPETGTWIGATPELLVGVRDGIHFRTVALAGTQRLQPGIDLKSVAWTQKDIEEQALVSRYIINCFKKIRLREFEEHGPKTAVAGNLMHLRTDFEVDMMATNFPQLGTIMLKLLHPTSAVCGMPLEPSMNFLRKNEGYSREYYSGFLGPVNFRNESQVFVNLRCMKLLGSVAWLYAGAGITVDSDPEPEWEETEMKLNTLLQVIGSAS